MKKTWAHTDKNIERHHEIQLSKEMECISFDCKVKTNQLKSWCVLKRSDHFISHDTQKHHHHRRHHDAYDTVTKALCLK